MNTIALGCVADDFTGASDVASFLSDRNINTILFNGIPSDDTVIGEDVQAIVIALKSRTDIKERAVKDSMDALQWMSDRGVKQLFVKYCSTFDSTREGNIGPIADAALEAWNIPYTILCPALPVNKRTIKDGCLYVDGIPLHESSMKNHPLTPMWDCRISELMKEQSKYPVYTVTADEYNNPEKLKERLDALTDADKHFYIVPDYYESEHAEKIVSLFGDLPLLTGGSGLMSMLAERYKKIYAYEEVLGVSDCVSGGAVILAGSCSVATLSQIDDYEKKGNKSYRIVPEDLMSGVQTKEEVEKFIRDHVNENVLIYTSAPAEQVKKTQECGREKVAALLESTTAELAKTAVEQLGITRIIVAGGETSGAVTKALGFSSYKIGSAIAPGVPIMIPLENEKIRLVLKSGNFGQVDFFTRAIKNTEE